MYHDLFKMTPNNILILQKMCTRPLLNDSMFIQWVLGGGEREYIFIYIIFILFFNQFSVNSIRFFLQ